ncbi:ABC transporter substrate-binding protein [Nocardioides sp. AN3]
MRLRSALVALTALTTVPLAAAACSSPAEHPAKHETAAPTPSASAGAFGGTDGLVAAAKKEGRLNVIALRPDWANYQGVIDGFRRKYGITVDSTQPDASSQEEVDTARRLQGKPTAPDVFDIGPAVSAANLDLFAPYKVATWDDIPAALKQPDGTAVNDYCGYMAIGYDAGTVPRITSLDDLQKPGFTGKVALTGDPTQSNTALNAVRLASIAEGGSAGDVAPGVAFFQRLAKAGRFLPRAATDQSVLSGQTSVVFDWDYLSAATTAKLPTWKVFVPPNAPLAGCYYQAINRHAPHPAAARLWEEYLYSDEGQNLLLSGGVRPVRAAAMLKAGTIDKAAYAKLPPTSAAPIRPTPQDDAKAAAYLDANWSQAIG